MTATPAGGAVSRLYRSCYARRIEVILILAGTLVVTALAAAGTGTVQISPADTLSAIGHQIVPAMFGPPADPRASVIVLDFRLPRILLAILTGISLAVAGTVMQGLLRNPLVSPFTLGLSSAASFGAALGIVIGPGILGSLFPGNESGVVICWAFLFGWLSMLLVYGIARNRYTSQATLILAGVVVGYLFQAGILLLKYLSNNEKLRELVLWLMGGMWGASWQAVILLVPICIACVAALELKAWDLNALSAGDDVARNLGINVGRFRLFGLLVSTLAASACLAFTGVIGFIGLMAPHICRMIIGNDYRYLIPCSALLGALILLVSDTAARTLMSPVEIPVGVIMYIIGGLFFLFLILRGKDRHIY